MNRRRRWKRQDLVSPPIGTRAKLSPETAQTIYSCPLLLSMSLLYILVGVTVVSSLSVPPLPMTRVGGDVVTRASSCYDTDTVSLFGGYLSSDTLNESDEKDSSEKHTIKSFPHSERQLKSIHSNAPAVLLKSGPGTGKTYALASRIAHLIQSGSCRPEQMVVLSFTNRDARTLKERAVQMYKRQTNDTEVTVTCKEVMDRLWSGTIHAFASSIIRTYSKTRRRHFRVINSKEMRVRVDKCLCLLLEKKHYGNRGGPSIAKLKQIRILHRDALADLRQSRGIVLHQVCRCFDLWKEAGVLPPPCVVGGVEKIPHNLGKKSVRDDCAEISMRLGISQNVAMLAIELYPQYQMLHESHGTADPSDLAAIATNILTSDTRALAAFRTRLKHVILDEYQDVSVTQHALIRTIVRGIVDQRTKDEAADSRASLPPVLDRVVPHQADSNVCYDVPRLFCGGDSQQSIYGWRGAAPYISTEGFRQDYPQGIVVPFDTSFRLSDQVWKIANGLINPKKNGNQKMNSRPTTSSENLLSLEPEDPDQSIRMLFSKLSDDEELLSPIRVQGLWDAREEGKFIASSIRKRCKARMKRCSDALGQNIGRDPSDVAIMVRSGKQLAFIKEALASVGVPFVVCESEEGTARPSRSQAGNLKLMDMKPVVVMTMHRAKGEEFDDVYLAGWTEGVFPHPTSISANRVDEERRLAFVAISRARQQVVITHSFTDRVLHNGPNLKSRYVTQQVSPSRFLYELVPAAKTSSADTVHNGGIIEKKSSKGLPSVVWYRGKGIKEHVAGRNVPDYFVNSYKAESSYLPAQSTNQAVSDAGIKENVSRGKPIVDIESDTPKASQECDSEAHFNRLTLDDQELLSHVRDGLDDCVKKVRGSKGKFKSLFRDLIGKRFSLKRGNVLVLPTEEDNDSYDALLGFEQNRLKKKPLSRATAIELGQYICFRLFSPFLDSS